MNWRNLGLFTIAALTLAALIAFAWQRRRKANVPATAVLVNGSYLDCPHSRWGFGSPCRVFDGSTGKLLKADPFSIRLRALAMRHGGAFLDCGTTRLNGTDQTVAQCAKRAFQSHKPFAAEYITDWGGGLSVGYAMLGDADGNVATATYDSRGFPDVRPTTRTELFDGDRVRLVPCIEPVLLTATDDGLAICIPPVNKEASEEAAKPKIIDTTICAIVQNPAAFNNLLVRIYGRASGNFEYSTLSGNSCSGDLWFTYPNNAPPGLVAHVPGSAAPGGEDAEGKRVLPVPIKLFLDSNFRHFERLMVERARQDEISSKRADGNYVAHEVAATFIGRVDAVSEPVHQFHLRRAAGDRADYLGFGQMGLFDAEFVMQSVGNDAKLQLGPPAADAEGTARKRK